MNQERIKERKGQFDGREHNHPGKHSTMRRIDSAIASLKDWRNQRTVAHEQGHREPELCFPGEIGGHFQVDQYQGGESEEIVLFFRDAKTQKDCE